MRKRVVMKLTELEASDASYISLVKAGAIRAPFKILKSEDGMKRLNLAALFGFGGTQEPATPAVAAYVAKSEDAPGIARALTASGITVAKTEERDGIVVMALKEDFEITEDSAVLRANDQVSVVLENVEKSFYSWPDTGDFAANVQKAGFFPGLNLGSQVLTETIYNIMEASSGEEAITRVQKAVADFGGYVEALVKAVPTEAFKAESLVPVAEEATSTETTETTETTEKADGTEGTEEGTPAETPETTEAVKTDDDDLDIDTAKAPATDPKLDVKKTEGSEEPVATEPTETKKSDDDLLAKIGGLITAAITPVTEQITAMKGELDGIKQTAGEALTLAKKTDGDLNGTVHTETAADDVAATVARKSEPTKAVFDTALKFEGFER